MTDITKLSLNGLLQLLDTTVELIEAKMPAVVYDEFEETLNEIVNKTIPGIRLAVLKAEDEAGEIERDRFINEHYIRGSELV